MKLTVHDLKNTKNPLLPVYLISGDEPLQKQEACDRLRQIATEQGFEERTHFSITPTFDWSALEQHATSLSLFSAKKLIEITLPSNPFTKVVTSHLRPLIEALTDDTVIVLMAQKLTAKDKYAALHKLIDGKGATVPIWPLPLTQLPQWITQRSKQKKLSLSPGAIKLLAQHTEGNLLACDQTLEKCKLLFGSEPIDEAKLSESIQDQSHFSLFDLSDACMGTNPSRAMHILQRLQMEGAESPLLIWTISRDIRLCYELHLADKTQQPLEPIYKKYQTFGNKKGHTLRLAKKHSELFWKQLLLEASKLDQIMKGVREGYFWDALSSLILKLMGVVPA